MTGHRCFCCGKPLSENEILYHKKCVNQLFGSSHIPVLNYTPEESNTTGRAGGLIKSPLKAVVHF